MASITRLEYYMAKAAGIYTGNVPTPTTRKEYYWSAITGDFTGALPAPITREEIYLATIAGSYTGSMPAPTTRKEMYLYAIAGGSVTLPAYITREEYYLAAIADAYSVKTVSGGGTVTLDNSKYAALSGLKIYGYSTQDGTPSPENPVEIVNAGNIGQINVTLSDGAEQSQSLAISVPGGLPGISEYDDPGQASLFTNYTYTDADGKRWVSDYIDFARKKYVKNTYFFTSSDISRIQYLQGYMDTPGSYGHFRLTFTNASTVPNRSPVFCNRLPNVYNWNVGASGVFCYGTNGVDISFPYDVIGITSESTGEEAIALLQDWMSSNPLTFLCVRNTPIETGLAAEEIAAYAALRTYAGTTIVSNDAEAWMEVSYEGGT